MQSSISQNPIYFAAFSAGRRIELVCVTAASASPTRRVAWRHADNPNAFDL